jgi:Fe-S cluster biogenesis protein NfuA
METALLLIVQPRRDTCRYWTGRGAVRLPPGGALGCRWVGVGIESAVLTLISPAFHDGGARMAEADKSLKDQVQEFIDMVRPHVQMDGGDVELIDVDDQGVVSVRLHGACVGCPSAQMTLKMGIERNLKERVPEVKEVICV